MHLLDDPGKRACVMDIYARFRNHVDTVVLELLKLNLPDAKLIRNENQRVFAKLDGLAGVLDQGCSSHPANSSSIATDRPTTNLSHQEDNPGGHSSPLCWDYPSEGPCLDAALAGRVGSVTDSDDVGEETERDPGDGRGGHSSHFCWGDSFEAFRSATALAASVESVIDSNNVGEETEGDPKDG